MLFKNIKNFNDLNSIENKNIANLILSSNTQDLKKFQDIDIASLGYDSLLSKIIYYLIKVTQTRNQDDFEICFKNTLEYLNNHEIDYINNFTYIIDMLFFIKKRFSLDIKKYIKEYSEMIITIDSSLELLWHGKIIAKNNYCDKNIIEYILSKLTWQHENDFLNILSKYCKNTLDVKNYYIKYAQKLEQIAEKEQNLKSIYFYELAIDIYNKYQKTTEVDRIKLIKNKISYNLEEFEVSLSDTIQKEFQEYIDKSKQMIDDLIKNNEYNKAFSLVFTNDMIPEKDENITNTINNQNRFRKLGNIISIGDGTKFTFESESDKKRYLEFENYCTSLDIHYNAISQLLNHLINKMDIYLLIDKMYQNSEIYDNSREEIIKDLIIKYRNNDIIGFNYIFLPTFEYLIKKIMDINGKSPYKTSKEEDKTLNKLLENSKFILEEIFGKDFYYLLENLFSYKFGLNIRNSLLHGNGISFLNKKYTDILFFIFTVLITYSRRIKDV